MNRHKLLSKVLKKTFKKVSVGNLLKNILLSILVDMNFITYPHKMIHTCFRVLKKSKSSESDRYFSKTHALMQENKHSEDLCHSNSLKVIHEQYLALDLLKNEKNNLALSSQYLKFKSTLERTQKVNDGALDCYKISFNF